MNLKMKLLIILTILLIFSGCKNNEKNSESLYISKQPVIKQIVIFEGDSLGNEYMQSITEYDESGYKKNRKLFNMNGKVKYSENIRIIDNTKRVDYFDLTNGSYHTLNEIKDGKIIYSKTIYDDETKLPIEAFFEYDENNNISSQITKYGENENISLIKYAYEKELIIEKTQENYNNDITSISKTENIYIDEKLSKQIITVNYKDTEQLKIIKEFQDGEKSYIEDQYTFKQHSKRNKYDNGLLVLALNYKDNEVEFQIKYEYDFDEYNNWILEKKYFKGKEDRGFGLLTEKKRIIEYYE